MDVRSIRSECDCTQEEFAYLVGVTVSTVNRWENGHIQPSRLAQSSMRRVRDSQKQTTMSMNTGHSERESEVQL